MPNPQLYFLQSLIPSFLISAIHTTFPRHSFLLKLLNLLLLRKPSWISDLGFSFHGINMILFSGKLRTHSSIHFLSLKCLHSYGEKNDTTKVQLTLSFIHSLTRYGLPLQVPLIPVISYNRTHFLARKPQQAIQTTNFIRVEESSCGFYYSASSSTLSCSFTNIDPSTTFTREENLLHMLSPFKLPES